ncbi:MAG: DUF4876 domain-containing protein [Bacteroidales bacterium]
MKKIHKPFGIIAVMALFCLIGCMQEKMDPANAAIIIQLQGLEGKACDLSNIPVRLQNTQLTVSYTALTDQEGKARFDVEYGFYRANAQYEYKTEYKRLFVNAASDAFVVNSRKEYLVSMESVYPRSEQLIFKEIYYACCVGANGKNYLKDQYLIIYNNSPEVAYLDSICLGFLDPMNANSAQKGWEGLSYLPIINFMWMFPGNGTDNPLQPGEQVVVGVNAINHIALGNTNSVDLSKEGYWAFYDEKANLTAQSVPAPGVKCLSNVWKYNGSSCLSSVVSPAWIMWKVQGMDMSAFLDSYIRKHPTNLTSNISYVTVPVEWVYDGVECFKESGYVKRLPTSIDNGFTSLPEGTGSGYSVHRVIDEVLSTPERIVYMDTNNSSRDFVKQTPSLKE